MQQSEESVAAREASATAHEDLTNDQATDLFTDVFGQELSELSVSFTDPLLTADEILRFKDESTAVIDPEGPETIH